MSTVFLSRALASLIAVEQGQYSAGYALVKSTGATGRVDAFDHATPILNGSMDEAFEVRVEPNPDDDEQGWDVTDAGVLVPITSVVAGTSANLPAGTELRWNPESTGIEAVSVVAPGGMAGGTQKTTFGALQQFRHYRTLGDRMGAEQFFRGQVGAYPAAVLAWAKTYPWDGSSTATAGGDATRVGEGVRLYRHEWHLYLVTSRLDGEERRRRESDTLRDNLLGLLTDATAHRGINLSSPDGLNVLDALPFALTDFTHVDLIRFTTTFGLANRELDEVYPDWEQTRQRVQTATQGEPPTKSPEIDVPDITYPTLPE